MEYSKNGFTLIELLVALSILSIIMVSVFTIFFLSNQINSKTDISRTLQENVKHVVETIAEDIRKNNIKWVVSGIDIGWCSNTSGSLEKGDKICIGSEYYLAIQNGNQYIRVSEDITKCQDYDVACVLVKDWQALSNSWVEFEQLQFTLIKGKPDKVQINFTLRPSGKKWVKRELIQENTLIFQTTLSKRIY